MMETYKIENFHPISQHSPFRRHHPALAPTKVFIIENKNLSEIMDK